MRVLRFANYSIGYIFVLQSQLAEQHNLSFSIGPNFQQSPLHSENTKYFITNKGTSGQRNTHAIRLLDESSLGQALQNIRKAKNQNPKNLKPKTDRKPKNRKPKNQKPKNHKPKNHKPKNRKPKNRKPKIQKPKNQRPKNQRPKNQRPENQRPENQEPKNAKVKNE